MCAHAVNPCKDYKKFEDWVKGSWSRIKLKEPLLKKAFVYMYIFTQKVERDLGKKRGKVRGKERDIEERAEKPPFYCLTPQIPSVAETGSGWSQELETHPMWESRDPIY